MTVIIRRLMLLALLLTCGRSWAASCIITTSGTLVDFGSYSSMTGPVNSQAILSFTCTPTSITETSIAYTIKISPGLAGNALDRRLFLNGNTSSSALRYNLFIDAARILIWGDGNNGTSFFSASCTLVLCPVTTVYGRLQGGQGGAPGPYRDDVSVTINF